MSDGRAEQIAELERRILSGARGEDHALLAELYRREGRPGDAERMAREALTREPGSGTGLAVLVLALLDADRGTEARIELEERAAGALAAWSEEGADRGAAPGTERLSEDEVERAFDAAEPQLDEMITPDRLAEEAALRVDAGFANAGAPLEETAAADAAPEPEPPPAPASSEELLGLGGAFSTRTMAELLEQQGDTQGAARIRAALGAAPVPVAPSDPAPGRHARVVAALERWLENVRRHST